MRIYLLDRTLEVGYTTTHRPTSRKEAPLVATVKLFYSYAHEDEQWRDELDKHLSALQRQQLIEGWHDREISGGQDWAYELARHLEEAHLILLLVSPDFMASSCQDVEVPLAMKRQRAG